MESGNPEPEYGSWMIVQRKQRITNVQLDRANQVGPFRPNQRDGPKRRSYPKPSLRKGPNKVSENEL